METTIEINEPISAIEKLKKYKTIFNEASENYRSFELELIHMRDLFESLRNFNSLRTDDILYSFLKMKGIALKHEPEWLEDFMKVSETFYILIHNITFHNRLIEEKENEYRTLAENHEKYESQLDEAMIK